MSIGSWFRIRNEGIFCNICLIGFTFGKLVLQGNDPVKFNSSSAIESEEEPILNQVAYNLPLLFESSNRNLDLFAAYFAASSIVLYRYSGQDNVGFILVEPPFGSDEDKKR